MGGATTICTDKTGTLTVSFHASKAFSLVKEAEQFLATGHWYVLKLYALLADDQVRGMMQLKTGDDVTSVSGNLHSCWLIT